MGPQTQPLNWLYEPVKKHFFDKKSTFYRPHSKGMWEGVIFSQLCVCSHGYPISIQQYFHWSLSFPGDTLFPSHNTSTGPMSFPRWGTPPARGWGIPQSGQEGGTPGWGTPGQGWVTPYPGMEYPQAGQDGGVPPSQGWGTPQDNRGSTCYAAGGKSLAFTQEDFLVNMDFKCKFTFFQWLL